MMLDEMERSVHDVLCVIRRVVEGKNLVIGGGSVEAALNVHLEDFASSMVIQLFHNSQIKSKGNMSS